MKYTFVLRINKDQTESPPIKNEVVKVSKSKVNVINVEELSTEEHNYSVKKSYNLIDLVGNHIPPNCGIRCYWCKQYFSNEGIGMPIRFVPNIEYHSYTSSLTGNIINRVERQDDGYFECVDVYCSYGCCLASIEDGVNGKSNCKSLLYAMFFLNGGHGVIKKSLHWKMLKEYGGDMDNISGESYIGESDGEVVKMCGEVFKYKVRWM